MRLFSFFSTKRTGQEPRTGRPQARQAAHQLRTEPRQPRDYGQQKPRAAVSPASPGGAGIEIFGGLSEEDVYALYKLAPIKQLAQGETLEMPGRGSPAVVHIVTGGSVDLGALFPEGKLSVAVLTKGKCVDLRSLSQQDRVAYQADAREPTTVIELNPDHLHNLSAQTSLFVARQLAATTSAVLSTLATRCADLSRANTELARCVQGFHDERVATGRSSAVAQVVKTIPKLPLHTTDLMNKLFAPDAHSNEIVELIKNDPPLAGLVLKTVNSPYFSLPTKVSDYYRAFLFLGTNNVYQLILDASMRDVLPDSPEGQEIQTHSYLVSLFMQEIAVAARLQPQVCSTIGLLHDIGKSVGLVLRVREPDLAPFVHLLDASELGASLLKRWEVPDEVWAVIERQHQPEFLPPEDVEEEYRRETAALYVAHLCAELAVDGEEVSTSIAYLPEYMKLLGLQESSLGTFYRQTLLPRVVKQVTRLPRRVRALLEPGMAPAGQEI